MEEVEITEVWNKQEGVIRQYINYGTKDELLINVKKITPKSN